MDCVAQMDCIIALQNLAEGGGGYERIHFGDPPSCLLLNNLVHHIPAHNRQPEIVALEADGEAAVVQDGGVQVVDLDDIIH